MFGRSKPVFLESYGRRRSRWHMPRWLLLLLSGLVAGAAAVLVVQERYLPPRLSVGASAELRNAFARADAERLRLRAELDASNLRLQTTLAEKSNVAEELSAARLSTTRLRDDLASVVSALPPDPRNGTVAVRAGRFTAKGGLLHYDLVLSRDRAGGKPMSGTLQLLVAGESLRGTPTTISAQAIPLLVGHHEVVRGSLPLPEGFKPRQTTVQVLDQPAGRQLGMRVLLID